MSDALNEALAARIELHKSDYWAAAARVKGKNHLWLCDVHLLATITELTPTPTPPPSVIPTWAYDVQAMTVADPQGGQKLAAIMGIPAYLNACSAYYVAKPGDKTYNLNAGNLDPAIPIGKGVQPSTGADHTLVILDYQSMREHSIEHAAYNASNDTWSASGGSSVPLGSSPEAASGKQNDSSGASRIPMLRGVLTAPMIKAGTIDVTMRLRISEPQVGPASGGNGNGWCPYPANTQYGGPGAAANPTFGTMYRLPAAVNVDTLGLDPVSATIAKGWQTHGLVITDGGQQGSHDAVDYVNQGGTQKTWADAGATLTNQGGMWVIKLSAKLPYALLERLAPPPKP
jgi:hypothetical protein